MDRRHASRDLVWRSLMTSLELPYRLSGLPADILRHWVPTSDASEQCLFRSTNIARLRLFVTKCPLDALTATNCIASGEAVRKFEKQDQLSKLSSAQAQSTPRKTNKAVAKTGMTIPDAFASDHAKATKPVRSLTDINSTLNAQRGYGGSHLESSSSSLIDLDGASVDLIKTNDPRISLAEVKIGRSGSAKLDYILDEVSGAASSLQTI